MIIGNGLLAKAFINTNTCYDDYVIFASGVSNSKETNPISFEREKALVLKTLDESEGLKFVYFSSVLAGLINNDYYNHKVEMENLIRANAKSYIIFKSPQIIGDGGNNHTLVNSIKTSIINDKEIFVFEDVTRALLGVDDLVRIVDYFKESTTQNTIVISSIEKLTVFEIVTLIADRLSKTPIITITKSNETHDWSFENNAMVNTCLKDLNITPKGYTDRVII